jgi:hypothetical protein
MMGRTRHRITVEFETDGGEDYDEAMMTLMSVGEITDEEIEEIPT